MNDRGSTDRVGRIRRPEVERDRHEGEGSVVGCDHEVPVGDACVGGTFGARSGGGGVVVQRHRLGRHDFCRRTSGADQQTRQHHEGAAKQSDNTHPPSPAIVCHDPVQLSCVFSLRTLSVDLRYDHRSFESSVTVGDQCWSDCSKCSLSGPTVTGSPWSTRWHSRRGCHDDRDARQSHDDGVALRPRLFRFSQGEEIVRISLVLNLTRS